MKNFFLVIINSVAASATKLLDFFKTFRFKAIAADIGASIKGLFSASSSYDGVTTRKRIAVLAGVVGVLVILVAVKAFIGSGGPKAAKITLKDHIQKDDDGTVWSLSLMKGQAAATIVQADKKPGPPLLVRTDAQCRGASVTVGLTMEGQAGEKYVPGVMKDGQWQNPPRYQLVTESGKVVGAGRFEYG